MGTESDKLPSDQHEQKCVICYPKANTDPLDFKTFSAVQEWAVHVPLVIQILMESYLNPKTFVPSENDQQSSQSDLISAKIQRLYIRHTSESI